MKKPKKIQGKLKDKGEYVVFVGYTDKYPHDTYRFLKLSTKKVIILRDVRFLNKTHKEWCKNPEEKHASSTQLADNYENSGILEDIDNDKEEEKSKPCVI